MIVVEGFDLADAIECIGTRHRPIETFVVTGGRAIVTHDDRYGQLGFLMVARGLRGQGVGSRLLAQVGRWADMTGRGLFLLPQPLDSHGMDGDELAAWYEHKGWERAVIPGERCEWMTRTPAV